MTTEPTADVTFEGDVTWHGRPARKWQITLTYQGRTMTTPYYTGIGLSGEPTAADVLDSLVSDASMFEECGHDPDEWAANLGQPDSIKQLLETIEQVARQTCELRDLLGADYDTHVWGES